MNEQTDQSILDELEHLIFDEHKIISYKWVTNHFKIPIQKSKQILSKFNTKFEDRLFVHHLITGFKSLTIKHSDPYNSVYVSPKLRKKSKSRLNTNTNTNSNESYMTDSDEDDMTQSQPCDIEKYPSVYAQKLCEDKKFEAEKSQFNKIVDIHIYCIARDEARNIKDFLNQQYEEDYHQQLKITTAWLSKQAEKYNQNKGSSSSQRASHKKEINELSRFSQISFDQCTTVPSPQLNRALARTKQEIQEREKKLNKNKNIKKQINFDEKIENFKKDKNKNKNRNKSPPINDKLMGLKLNNDDAKSSSSSLSPNAMNNKNKVKVVGKKKKNDIRGAFAKAKEIKDKQDHDKQSQTQQSQIEEEIEKQKKLTKRKKAGTINNFFNTEAEEKEKAKSKKKSSKKKAKKVTKTKKKGGKKNKKKKEKIGSLKPARKRKRGAMEESNLIPIEYGSESSNDEDMDNGYDGVDDDDEELEAIKRSFKPNRNKRRKVMVDSDEDSDKDEDDDIDLDDKDDNVENESPKKLTKRELKQIQHEKELKERKNNFFGAAKNNPVRKKKKYKIVAHSYINEKGLFVTEDKKVTDDEDTDNDGNDGEQKEKERVHKFQHIEYDEDDDIAMKNKENSVDKLNGKNSKKNKNKNTVNSKKKKKKKVTPKKRKNGSITSFFKKK